MIAPRFANLLLNTLLTAAVWCSVNVHAVDATALLFSFFRGNGEAGLFLATSEDGLKWTELKPPGASFLKPAVGGKVMRDPSLALGPDGTFRMVWTTSWKQPLAFGYASSKDLVNWSQQKAVAVMENDRNAQNVWAPELFYDEAKSQWLIFWASTVPGKFPKTDRSGDNNHRIYYVTTKDFVSFSPTRLFYDGGFNVIDATLLPANGKFYLVVKDETRTPPRKNLRLVEGLTPEGPWSIASDPITISWVEGPSALRVGAEFIIYFDHYTAPQYYGAVKCADFASWQDPKQWQDISKQVSFPKGARHGTALRVPAAIVQNLTSTKTNSLPRTP